MIQIKRNNKVFFTLEDFGEGSKLSYQLMDHHYIILKFTTATPIYFEIGDSVEIPDFGYFELTSSYFPKHNDSDGYDYEMQMDAYYMSWKNKLCKYRPQHGVNETSFKLTTTVGVHMNVILGNLKALGLTYNGKEFSVDYTTYNNKAFDVQKRFLIEYGSISILDALNAICSEDALNCEWWIDGSIIYLGYCEMEGQTTFEQDVNVLSMSYSESKSTYITRLYAFGSDRNIPKGYFTGADADVTTDGVATDYLMLPNKEVDSDGFYAKDGYLENVNVVKNDKQAIEGVVMFDEEYPKVECRVSSIKTYDSTVDNEDGTKTTQTFWQVTSTDSFTNNFKESWIKSNLTLGIKFTSGALMGMEFDVSFKVIDKVNYFEIVANDTYGRTLPDGVMCPKVGDKYFLFNWDATKITDTDLIPTAQLSLFDRSKQYYQKTMISNSNFTCTMDGDKFYNDGTYDYHPLGEQVKLINDMFAQVDADGKHYRNSRIIGMEIPLDIPYDHPQYTVGEKAATSRLGKLEDKVDSIKVNGMQIGGTGSGNGGGVYVIGMNDTTPASDSNVYSARRSRMEFVSRLQDNIAKGTITWEKVQKFLGGLLVGNSNNENGGSWTPDAEGRSHLNTDYLEVRMKAIFEELVINKTSTIGGKEIISPAGGVVAHKVEEVTVTYNNVSQKAYRCYFLAEQEGNAVDNDFAVGDQVRSESFNVRKGTYHKAGNHFYWRFVIGRDEDPVELEGKKYHYIDLSDTDCATASDVPAKGDVLNQCGNRTDVERQNCLIFSAVDTYSPSISLYHGINSYSFANREYVEYGVNKQNNKAFFHVYGDMYFGDRPTSANNYEGESYVKFDSETKKVTIKGELDIKSTYDGKTLDKYIADKSLDKDAVETIIKKSHTIIDLQNQIDGAIETWFYDGVPTLKNAPAISWKTDEDKETHLGDLYYDNKTGKAYRFAKDGSTYEWIIITDTELTKALKDSSQALKDAAAADKKANGAQATANTKRRIFGSQPVPPYDVNDMWVNATYPNDGSTYKNEILKCSTAKAEGEKFDIADWKLASKYTDDTKAEEAKKAAEKAQEEIKTTQSNLNALGTTVTENKKTFDSYVKDGYLEPSEIAAMAQDSKRLEDAFAAAEKSYNEVKGAEVLKSTKELTDLNTAFTTLSTAKTELVTYLSDISTNYNKADTNGKAAIVSAVGTKFTNFQSAYSAFYDKLGLANAYITSKIYGDLKQNITDLAGYKYLKDALGQTTYVDGGLVMTTLLALRDGDGNVQSGINGAIDPNRGKKSIATWWGGQMVDKDYNSGNLTPATSLIRFDGSGYLANGAIWWDVSGKVHADPTSFIISEKNLGAYLTFFEPTWKEGSAGTSVADLVSLKPNAPFSKLGVSGDATFEGAISFHGIKITYDATNKAIKIDGNLYATGGITAYGAGASTTGGGGGLNGSVKSYSNALKLTSESLSEIASAYSIKALDSRISSLEGGSAMDVSVSGSGNAVTAISKSGTTIIVTKGTTFLTSHQSLASYLTKTDAASLYQPKGNYLTAHQSLDGYVNAIAVSGSGNAITSVSKSGKGITFTKGATFLISHQSLANYYTKSSVDSLLSGKSATSHTHSVKINGVTKTIAASGGTAVDLGTYLTSHQSLADYAKKSEIPTKVSQLTNDSGYITSSGSCAYATNADKVDGVHVTWAGVLTSTNHLVAWEADGSALRDINPANVSVGNSDKLDGIHANGLLTALSNSDKGISITVGGTTKSVSNISVNYASSAGNADTVDGYHESSFLRYRGEYGDASVTKDGVGVYGWAHTNEGHNNFHESYGDIINIQGYSTWRTRFDIGTSGRIRIMHGINTTTATQVGYLAYLHDNVASATKLRTPRTIWGQSFDGTGNVDGTLTITNSGSDDPHIISTVSKWFHIVSKYKLVLYAGEYNSSQKDAINILSNHNVGIGVDPSYKLHVKGDIYSSATIRTAAQNQAIMLTNDASPAWISALEGQVIFNTGKAIRFGETAWDWNQWAGLKYNHSDKTIYLGIADGSAFNANTPQLDGTLRLAGIKTIIPNAGARIGGSGGNLYLGNANNTNWVKVQDMCSQVSSRYWSIMQTGSATFTSLTVNDVISCDSISVSKNAVIAGNLSVNGLINNKGILPTDYDVNKKGAGCYVSADALCSGITAITDSIPVDNLSIVYTNDNGNSWTNYNISNDTKFKAYANVAGVNSLYLGSNVITGNTDAEKLAQIKKNELMFSFEIPNSCYSQVYFACVDIGQGVGVTCTVEYLNSKGVIVNTYIKYMTGWNQFNYINLSNGNTAVGVGNDDRRYIRFRFKHDQNTTALRNASINKIRIFAFTKYSFPTDRFMGHTGHIYNYDYNMNTYFPNSILAKGGVTAYQSSDIRLKQDLRKLDYLGIIKAMGGTYGFAWKKDNTRSIGWIAQHVLHNPQLKDIVETDEKGYYKINYWSPKLIATAFGAIEQVGDEVSRLKARVIFLESEVQRLSGDKEDCNKKRLDNKNINLLN
ncbi:hypothetical protein ONT15_06205 [Prevotella copri]|uniref:Uncharacterized protein n=1 Tax=Segatella copri TaxID=165179 RepID=A0AAW5TZK9_9BACT|nr:hypothetical protein [Segatella copri]MCW4098997.1 hypothetical protein [Segatella copri]MCW4130060.1 hypothetical protein [Segatella copri]MCW4163342.1 hypothetical protein [Segatella copri]